MHNRRGGTTTTSSSSSSSSRTSPPSDDGRVIVIDNDDDDDVVVDHRHHHQVLLGSSSSSSSSRRKKAPPPPRKWRRRGWWWRWSAWTIWPLLLTTAFLVGALRLLRRSTSSSSSSSSGDGAKSPREDELAIANLRDVRVKKSVAGRRVIGAASSAGGGGDGIIIAPSSERAAASSSSSSSSSSSPSSSSSSSSSSSYSRGSGGREKNVEDGVGIASPKTNATIHLIFSTDCGSYQHWQSYLFFHSAHKIRQPGYVTRIASGCTDDEMSSEKEWHDVHIRGVMSDRYRIHFTPKFSGVKDEKTGEVRGDYKFYNKPFGLRHFLEHGELAGLLADDDNDGAGVGGGGGAMKHPDDVIILADPDFLLLRPLTDDYSDEAETLVGERRSSAYRRTAGEPGGNVVRPGRPYAQAYGLGTQWRAFDLEAIAGPGSPARGVSQSDGGLYYPAGPPYVAVASDMYRIAVAWSDFVPRVHAEYPHLLGEMYAYCIAAAHLRLPHGIVDSMMVSAVGNGGGAGGEGWQFVRDVPSGEVCAYGRRDPDHASRRVPSAVHYCQHYGVSSYMFGKRRVPHGIFTCDHPPLVEPPDDLGSGRYPWVVPRKGSKKVEISAEKEKMEAFMVCALTRAVNDAMAFFKSNGNCDGGGEGNAKKAYDMWAGEEISVEQ